MAHYLWGYPMLLNEIEQAQRLVKTDAYQMSIGEIVTMYEDKELTIDPEFQRLFRWKIGQKSKLIESLLLGIPIPSIFVFEKDDGTWELIDGLQRISTILEFMGRLREGDGLRVPSVLEATKYLPSLHNGVWEASDRINDVPKAEQSAIDRSLQLAIRRSRIAVEILKRPSDDQTKYDLFQRLNAGGSQANAQELRNCIVLMINGVYFREVKAAAEQGIFQTIISVGEDQQEKQRHMELAMRFLAHALIPYDGRLDVEEYIDESSVSLARAGDAEGAVNLINQTFSLLHRAAGDDALKRFENGHHVGRVGLVGLEGIAVGVAKNLPAILALGEGAGVFVKGKIETFWLQPAVATFTSPGLRGTVRIQRTVPFGEAWFKP
ncbi:DUF262 domain-containing protein [Labrys okinawensis]|nr:DUF262 domain-containing protein [Labrys okinawensis]